MTDQESVDCCGEAGRECADHANVELKAVLAAVQQNGHALEHANVELKVDREVESRARS